MSDFQNARNLDGMPTRGQLKKQVAELKAENKRLRRALLESQSKLAESFVKAWFDDRANRRANSGPQEG
jgi:hypothetical protein